MSTLVVGDQRPRIECAPAASVSSAQDAIDLAEACGLVLDDWQQHVLRQSLGERDDGRWAAYDVGLVVARQNGKGAVLMARELAGALLFGERLIVHSAHELDTARDHLKKLNELAEGSPFLREQLPADGIKWGRGYEEAQFVNGAVIRFKSRSRKGGRGLSGDLVVFDEAFDLEDVSVGAIAPLLRARPNPQIWYASSVVDQQTMPNGHVLAGLRRRALSDDPGSLAYCEWSNPDGLVEGLTADELRRVLRDPEVHAAANPALAIRITSEQILSEIDSMPLRQFLVECLSVGDWPDPDVTDGRSPFDLDVWSSLADPDVPLPDRPVIGCAVSGDRARGAIGVAGASGGKVVTRLVAGRPGKAWIRDTVASLTGGKPATVVIDGWSDLERDLAGLPGVDLKIVGASDVAAACARVLDGTVERTLVHAGQDEVDTAVEHVHTRRMGGGLAWKAPPDGTDVTPLGAITLAVWACGEPSSSSRGFAMVIGGDE